MRQAPSQMLLVACNIEAASAADAVSTVVPPRFGEGSSGEFWSGGTLSYCGLNFGAGQIVRQAYLASRNYKYDGIERGARAMEHGGNETLLFYVGLEFALSSPKMPDWEF